MGIIHETKYQKEDGTKIDIVPLKDIVVTVPGYSASSTDWRDDLSDKSTQTSRLYEARNKAYPDRADYCEEIDFSPSSNGGRARFRTYIEKAKLPQLEQEIKDSIKYGSPKKTLFSSMRLGSGFSKDHETFLPLGPETERIISIKGWHIGFRRNSFGDPQAIFYMPKLFTQKDSIVGYLIDYQLAIKEGYRTDENKNWISVYDFNTMQKGSLNRILAGLDNSSEGLTDKIRADVFRDLIAKNKQ